MIGGLYYKRGCRENAGFLMSIGLIFAAGGVRQLVVGNYFWVLRFVVDSAQAFLNREAYNSQPQQFISRGVR